MIVGYYVHHRGSGHWARYAAIRDAADVDVRSISELPEAHAVLPPDAPARNPDTNGALHWAPDEPAVGLPRAQAFLRALEQWQPMTVVIDVSVEAALLARLAGHAPIVVRQHGDREDRPHRTAYDVARTLVAPFPALLEDPRTPERVRCRTYYAGFVVPTCGEAPVRSALPAGPGDVVVLWGSGGTGPRTGWIESLARHVDGTVHLLGASIRTSVTNIECHGWVDRPQDFLTRRPVVVTTAGNNTVSLAGRHACPLIVLPQDRPFAEQVRHAERLVDLGLAVDARSGHWPELLRRAATTGERWAALEAHFDGAQRAAELFSAVGTAAA